LEAYLETAGQTGCAGFCEEIADEEDDAPDYEEELSGYRVDPIEEAETDLVDWDFRKKLQPQLDRLDPKEKEIIELHNGLGGERMHTLEEIGRRYGVTRERIRQIEQGAVKNLQTLCWRKAHPNEQVSQNKDIEPQKEQTGKVCLQKKLPDKVHLKEEKPKSLLFDIKSDRRTNRRLWELLLDYRIEHDLNQAKMAKLCGISEDTLSRLEKPYSMYCPSSKILVKVFENLEISEDAFMEVITHDEKFRNKNLTWIWEQRNEDRLLKYYHQMNRERREFALEQMKALAELKKD
jgi:DNA-directed RNA polymerase specialized sigma subunit